MKLSIKYIIFLTLLLNCSVGMACNSYESCLDAVHYEMPDGTIVKAVEGSQESEPFYLKAIAYKLADIEKELKKRD